MSTTLNTVVTYWRHAEDFTGRAIGAGIFGCRFVKIVEGGVNANPGVALATAADQVAGVSQNDCAQNDTVGVKCAGVYSVLAGVALLAGQPVYSDANGQAVATGTNFAGTCWADTAVGALAPIKINK